MFFDPHKAEVISIHYKKSDQQNAHSESKELREGKNKHLSKVLSPRTAEQKIIEHLDKTTKKTLIIIDIDYLLLHPQNPMFQMGSLKHHNKAVEWSLNRLSNAEQDIFVNFMLSKEPSDVLSPLIVKKIKNLVKNKRTVLGISAELTQPLSYPKWGSISMTQEKLKKLKLHDIAFYPRTQHFVLHELPEHKNGYPEFQNGVIFTNGERVSHGDLLKVFIPIFSCQNTYDTVLYIGDKLANCKKVDEKLREIERPKFKKVTVIHFDKADAFPMNQEEAVPFERNLIDYIKKNITEAFQ